MTQDNTPKVAIKPTPEISIERKQRFRVGSLRGKVTTSAGGENKNNIRSGDRRVPREARPVGGKLHKLLR